MSNGFAESDQARLTTALSARYTITGVLGQGGMAVVYRATDLKHDRQVAIKVLHSELSQALGAERFLHEIGILARLQHPRILPLYDSGEAAGLLYYVMPLVEGETLRDRIVREKQLAIDEAVRITRDVASALAYAHERGVVHRDIKPENILLSGREAIVADFGIARAVSAANDTRLTATGVSVGTPVYMSPEQASGDPNVDWRSDIYSLGCVLYEMLAGEPPYGGSTAEVVLRRHIAAPIPQVTVVRSTVSADLSAVIEQALAKVPTDRFDSAADMMAALEDPSVSLTTRLRPVDALRPRNRHALVWVAAVVAALGIGGTLMQRRLSRPAVDRSRIAVLPFRVSGDSGVAYLREGLVDLLTTQLASSGDMRPLDSRTVLAAWKRWLPSGGDPTEREARELAIRLGSGRVVDGSVVGAGSELSVAAQMVDVDGSNPVSASVKGPRDSLFSLVDRLTSQLIAGSVREPARRLQEITSASLPAVRAYLDGRVALRGGEIDRASQLFTRALELDSTFALAALGMAAAGVWPQQSGQSEALRRGLLTGYALRTRLSRADQLLFEAWVLPGSPAARTAHEQLVAWERAAEAAPESPEAQYEYGDRLYHSGRQLGIGDAEARAESAFVRAFTLDSSYAAPLSHLVELAARRDDADRSRRSAALYSAEAARADAGDYIRWRVALATRDERTLADLRRRIRQLTQGSLHRIVGFGQTDVVSLTDVDSAAIELQRRLELNSYVEGNVHPGQILYTWALNRGRAADAARALELLRRGDVRPAGASIVYFNADQAAVLAAMFWEGDSATARAAASRLEQRLTGSTPTDRAKSARRQTDLCVAALYHEQLGDTNRALRYLQSLQVAASRNDSTGLDGADPSVCVALIEVQQAARSKDATLARRLARLDSLLVRAPYVFGSDWGSLVLSRGYEAAGDRAAALRVVRRRPYDWDTGPLYHSTYLREEARLAQLAGDGAGAERARRLLDALRSR